MPLRAALRRALALLVRAGGVPAHLAFIMDGNRRFADRAGLQRLEGHNVGYRKARRRARAGGGRGGGDNSTRRTSCRTPSPGGRQR